MSDVTQRELDYLVSTIGDGTTTREERVKAMGLARCLFERQKEQPARSTISKGASGLPGRGRSRRSRSYHPTHMGQQEPGEELCTDCSTGLTS